MKTEKNITYSDLDREQVGGQMIKDGIYKSTFKVSCSCGEDDALDEYKKLIPINDEKIIEHGIEILENSRVYDYESDVVSLKFRILRNDFDLISSFFLYTKEGLKFESIGIPRETIYEPEEECREVVDEMNHAIQSYKKENNETV